MGFLWRYYACMEGQIYDVTEWASCQVRHSSVGRPFGIRVWKFRTSEIQKLSLKFRFNLKVFVALKSFPVLEVYRFSVGLYLWIRLVLALLEVLLLKHELNLTVATKQTTGHQFHFAQCTHTHMHNQSIIV